jgi:DNA-binding MarR family transcriptional regulator
MADADLTAALTRELRRLAGALHEADGSYAARLGLGMNDVAALEHLRRDGPLGPSELAQRLAISTASTTALLDRLEASGDVRRCAHPDDRRRVVVKTTRAAERRAVAALRPMTSLLDAAAGPLSQAEAETALAYLERVTQAVLDFARG